MLSVLIIISFYNRIDQAKLFGIILVIVLGVKTTLAEQLGTLDQRIKRALKVARIDGRGISQGILAYRITDQNALVEIAKLAAADDGHGVSKFIQNYGITDQNALIEIAKLAAAEDGHGISKFIKN